MNADTSRRNFPNGVSVAIGASLLPAASVAQDIGAQDLAGYYPPELTGMRSSHPGSFKVAHMAREGATWEGADSGEEYDLIVVGAGISGLSAASLVLRHNIFILFSIRISIARWDWHRAAFSLTRKPSAPITWQWAT